MTKYHSQLFIFFAIVGIFIAGNHLIGVFIKIDNSSPIRHAVFVLINLFFSYLFWKKSRLLVWLFPILMVQQYMGHGKRLITELAQNNFHIADVFVVLMLPIAYYLILSKFVFSKK